MQTRENARTPEFQSCSTRYSSPAISYGKPEVVGVFPDEAELEAAVDQLLLSGFDRQQISVLANWPSRSEGRGSAAGIPAATALEDDPRTRPGAFVLSASRTEFEAAAVGPPVYVAGLGGYAAVVASGGSLALALAALLLVGAGGACLGGFLARTIARSHREAIAAQVARGGLLLWVQVRSADQEGRAMRVLKEHGARHVHLHCIEREWGIEDVPFHEAQPDPFLERRPPIGGAS
jgi:hypothetical protein